MIQNFPLLCKVFLFLFDVSIRRMFLGDVGNSNINHLSVPTQASNFPCYHDFSPLFAFEFPPAQVGLQELYLTVRATRAKITLLFEVCRSYSFLFRIPR